MRMPSAVEPSAIGLMTLLSLGLGLMGPLQPAIAQERTTFDGEPIEFETIPEAFQRGITFSSQDSFSTTASIGRQFDFIFGFAGFPDAELGRDSYIFDSMYHETWYRQYSLGPLMRTPDLPNPYNNSNVYSSGFGSNPVLFGPTQTVPGSEYWLPPSR